MTAIWDKLKGLKPVKIGLSNLLTLVACCLLAVVIIQLFQIADVASEILASIDAAQERGLDASIETSPEISELLNEVKEIRELTCEVANNTDKLGGTVYSIGKHRSC